MPNVALVAVGVVAELVTCRKDLSRRVGMTLQIFSDQEEGRLYVISVEDGENGGNPTRSGAIVEGQRDDLVFGVDPACQRAGQLEAWGLRKRVEPEEEGRDTQNGQRAPSKHTPYRESAAHQHPPLQSRVRSTCKVVCPIA